MHACKFFLHKTKKKWKPPTIHSHICHLQFDMGFWHDLKTDCYSVRVSYINTISIKQQNPLRISLNCLKFFLVLIKIKTNWFAQSAVKIYVQFACESSMEFREWIFPNEFQTIKELFGFIWKLRVFFLLIHYWRLLGAKFDIRLKNALIESKSMRKATS